MSISVVRHHPLSYSRVSFEHLWRDVYIVISDRIHCMLGESCKRSNEINYIINELNKVDEYKNILTCTNDSDEIEITTGYALEINKNHVDKIVMIIRAETVDVWVEYGYVD